MRRVVDKVRQWFKPAPVDLKTGKLAAVNRERSAMFQALARRCEAATEEQMSSEPAT